MSKEKYLRGNSVAHSLCMKCNRSIWHEVQAISRLRSHSYKLMALWSAIQTCLNRSTVHCHIPLALLKTEKPVSHSNLRITAEVVNCLRSVISTFMAWVMVTSIILYILNVPSLNCAHFDSYLLFSMKKDTGYQAVKKHKCNTLVSKRREPYINVPLQLH